MEGTVFTRSYQLEVPRCTPLTALVFRDTYADPFFVTVRAPALLVLPVRARLGFRSMGAPVEPRDMRLAWVVLRRGEEVGASFPTLAQVHGFMRGLWVMA